MKCLFCGKMEMEVIVIQGPNGLYICEECVQIASQLVELERDLEYEEEVYD